jgi:hypothetical protein
MTAAASDVNIVGGHLLSASVRGAMALAVEREGVPFLLGRI